MYFTEQDVDYLSTLPLNEVAEVFTDEIFRDMVDLGTLAMAGECWDDALYMSITLEDLWIQIQHL